MNGCIINKSTEVFILIAASGDIFKDNRMCWLPNGFFLRSILMWSFGSETITPFFIWCNGNGTRRKRGGRTSNNFVLQPEQQDESLHFIIWWHTGIASHALPTIFFSAAVIETSPSLTNSTWAGALYSSCLPKLLRLSGNWSVWISINSFAIVIKISTACFAWENQAW